MKQPSYGIGILILLVIITLMVIGFVRASIGSVTATRNAYTDTYSRFGSRLR